MTQPSTSIRADAVALVKSLLDSGYSITSEKTPSEEFKIAVATAEGVQVGLGFGDTFDDALFAAASDCQLCVFPEHERLAE